LQI
jgi:hypothetical protein